VESVGSTPKETREEVATVPVGLVTDMKEETCPATA
jgi:hypothetical protein